MKCLKKVGLTVKLVEQVIRPNIGGKQQGFSNVVIDCVLKLLLMSIFGLGYSLERDRTYTYYLQLRL